MRNQKLDSDWQAVQVLESSRIEVNRCQEANKLLARANQHLQDTNADLRQLLDSHLSEHIIGCDNIDRAVRSMIQHQRDRAAKARHSQLSPFEANGPTNDPATPTHEQSKFDLRPINGFIIASDIEQSPTEPPAEVREDG